MEDEERRELFRGKLVAYVRLYAFMAQIIPYSDRELEMLYSYGRILLKHLPVDKTTTIMHPEDDVLLSHYLL